MANTASVEYYIEGEEKELEQIYNILEDLYRGNIKPKENTSYNWGGNICLAVGDDNTKYADMRCFIDWYELEKGDYLHLSTSEAWGVTDFIVMLKNNFPSIKAYYFCEENGCEVYETNDFEKKYFDEECVLDYEISGECDTARFMTEGDALSFLSNALQIEDLTIDKLEEWNKSNNTENFYYAYIYPIVRIEYKDI